MGTGGVLPVRTEVVHQSALGGQIFLHSPRGAGTSLRVELPVTAPTTDAH